MEGGLFVTCWRVLRASLYALLLPEPAFRRLGHSGTILRAGLRGQPLGALHDN